MVKSKPPVWVERKLCPGPSSDTPQTGSQWGLCGQREPQAIPPVLLPRIRAVAAQHRALRALPASPGGKLSCPLTCFNQLCHSCSSITLKVEWEGFCSAGRFWGGSLCLSSTAGGKEQLLRDLLALLGKGSSQGDSRGRGRNKSRPVGLRRSCQV